MKKLHLMSTVSACILAFTLSTSVNAGTIYFNGFETGISGWNAFGGSYDPTRVASGTNGITSASGGFHAESSASGSAGNWGGYNFGAGSSVFQEYTTSVDIYLNVGGGWDNDTRFDFSSAINKNNGDPLRDFIFNAGFYDSADTTGPGSGTNRFIISASNNSSPSSAYPKNPGRNPIAISTTGWYNYQHKFYDNSGVLAVDMSIFDSSSSLINMWTLSDPSDQIAGVGGNRYGWFDYNKFNVLAFDNSSLSTSAVSVPTPATFWLLGPGLLGLMGIARRKKTA